MIRLVLVGLLGGLAGVWEVAVTPFLPPGLVVQPLLPLAVLLLVASHPSRSFLAVVLGGIVMDVYNPVSLFATIRLSIVVLLLFAIARHWLTNRSLYVTLVLMVVGRLSECFSAWLMEIVTGVMPGSFFIRERFTEPLPSLLIDVILVTFAFLFLALFTRRFLVAFSKRPG